MSGTQSVNKLTMSQSIGWLYKLSCCQMQALQARHCDDVEADLSPLTEADVDFCRRRPPLMTTALQIL